RSALDEPVPKPANSSLFRDRDRLESRQYFPGQKWKRKAAAIAAHGVGKISNCGLAQDLKTPAGLQRRLCLHQRFCHSHSGEQFAEVDRQTLDKSPRDVPPKNLELFLANR